jgi:hypothetical protein
MNYERFYEHKLINFLDMQICWISSTTVNGAREYSAELL